MILAGLKKMNSFFRGEGNIMYPLYYEGYEFDDSEWMKALDSIENIGKSKSQFMWRKSSPT